MFCFCSSSRYLEAFPVYQRTLAIRETQLGPKDPRVARTLNGLAFCYQCMGDLSRARPLFQRALEIVETDDGPQHPVVAASLTYLGLLSSAEGKPADALPLFERALAIYEAAHGPHHPNVSAALTNVASVLGEQPGQLKVARALVKRAQTIDSTLRPDHPNFEEFRRLAHKLKAQRRCRTCNQHCVDMQTCGRCAYEWYCSVDCQKSDWPRHKTECLTPAERNAAEPGVLGMKKD